jgi:hypothetical protein
MHLPIFRRIIILLSTCTFLAWFFFLSTPTIYADGGAPNLAYVAGTPDGVSIIDVAQQTITRTFKIPGDPHTIQLSLDARFLYVTQPEVNKVAVVAAKTGETLCTADVPGEPTLLALDKGSGNIFVAGNKASGVREIDPATCKITHTYETKGPVYGVAVAVVASSLSKENGNQVWIATENELNVFDNVSGKSLGTISIEGGPEYISIPPGATVYVTTRTGTVVAVDLRMDQAIPLIKGSRYGPMDYDEITGEVYVPDLQNKRLVVLAPVNVGATSYPKQPARMIDIGVKPESVAITSDGQLGFVALDGGNVAMLDVPARQVITTFPVGGTPHFIITGMYPPVIGTTPQQATIWSTVLNVAAYAFVIALLVVPILLFRKYAKANRILDKEENQAKQNKRDEVSTE